MVLVFASRFLEHPKLFITYKKGNMNQTIKNIFHKFLNLFTKKPTVWQPHWKCDLYINDTLISNRVTAKVRYRPKPVTITKGFCGNYPNSDITEIFVKGSGFKDLEKYMNDLQLVKLMLKRHGHSLEVDGIFNELTTGITTNNASFSFMGGSKIIK